MWVGTHQGDKEELSVEVEVENGDERVGPT